MTARRQPLAHLGTNLRFILRYNRVRIVVWLILTVGMVGFIGAYYASLDPTALRELIIAGGTDSMKSLLGWVSAADVAEAPLGAAVWIKSWMFIAVMLCIGMIFLVTHNLRADEDSGRTELFRSGALGSHSALLSTVIMTVVLVLIVGVGIAAFGVAQHWGVPLGASTTTDPDPLGSVAFGASITAMGLFGIGVGVLTNELMPTAGAANGVGSAIVAVFYIVRMGADVGNSALTWASPIAWAQQMDPWGANRWWPLAALAGLAVLLIVVGWIIEARRDYGGSVFVSRLGPARAKRWMTTVIGLAIRQQRVAWLGWLIASVVFALMLGSITPMMAEMFESVDIAGLDVSAGMLAVVGLLVAMMSLGVASFVVYSTSTLATDDITGVLEHQLAGSLSRTTWALRRLLVSFVGVMVLLFAFDAVYAASYCAGMKDWSDFGSILGAVVVYIPSVLVLMGVVVLGFGWWPRQSIAVGWGFFGALWFIMILGEALRLPDEVLQSLPFVSASTVPSESPDGTTMAVTAVIGLGLIAAGLLRFRRRDIPG